jgi:hypothetical protein
MQTFITSFNQTETAKNLDNKRLGKQRVEAIQIANCLLIKENRWKNHPAVKMWEGNTNYLILIYLKEILEEWEKRGFKNFKCQEHFNTLKNLAYHTVNKNYEIFALKPIWVTEEFILSHKSNLIRKNSDYYKPIFGYDIPDNLPYIWPV